MRLVSLSLLAFLVACNGPVDKKQVDDMAERMAALEKKVEELEKRPAASARPSTKDAAPMADANSPEEQAATALMQEIQQAMTAADFQTAKAKLAELQSKYPTTRAAKASTRMSAELTLIGTDAKALDVEKWYQGKAALTDSKATLLVFWETWCPHCQREMPKMQPLAEKWQGKGLQVVALTKVTKSASDETVTAFLKEHEIKIPVAKEKDGGMSQAYNVSGIPAAALVKDGKVVWRGHPARLTDEMLEKLISG